MDLLFAFIFIFIFYSVCIEFIKNYIISVESAFVVGIIASIIADVILGTIL